jgi:hypothetical protein
MYENDNRISPSRFALKKVANLPRQPIEKLKAEILERYQQPLAQEQTAKAVPAPAAQRG